MKIAIDPGWSGGLAVQFNNGKTEAIACPETQADMILFIRDYAASEEKKSAVIEKVHAMPGQGVSSTWKFAVNYATWQSALIAFHIPFVEVSPQSWQKIFGNLPKEKKERKKAIRDQVQKRYPQLKVNLVNADALAMLSIFEKIT